MAIIPIEIVGTANFAPVMAQINALKASMAQLNATSAKTGGIGAPQLASLRAAESSMLAATRATGLFRVETVGVSSAAEAMTSKFAAGKLHMADYFNLARKGATSAGMSLDKMAASQSRLMSGLAVPSATKAGMANYITEVNGVGNALTFATIKQQMLNSAWNMGATKLIDMGKNVQWAGRQLMVGFTMPVLALGGALAAMYYKMEKNMMLFKRVYGLGGSAGGQFQNILPSQKEIDDISNKVMDLSKKMAGMYGASADEVTAVAAGMAQAGYTQDKLLAMTEQTVRAIKLGGLDQDTAIKSAIALQNTYKLSIDQTSESINFLSAVQASTTANMKDLTDAIPRVGNVVEKAGGSYKDMVAMIVSMKEGGVAASDAANAIKNSMQRIISPTKKAQDVMAAFGIDIKGIVSTNAGDLVGTLTSLQDAFGKLSPLAKLQAATELFGKYQANRMLALIDNFNKAGTQSAKVMQMQNLSAKELADMAQHETEQIQLSGAGQFQIAIQSLKDDLMPLGQQFLSIFSKIITVIDGIVKGLSFLKPYKDIFLFVLGGVGIAGPLLMISGLFMNLIGQFIKAGLRVVMFGQGIKLAFMSGLAGPKTFFSTISAGLRNFFEETDAATEASKQLAAESEISAKKQADGFTTLTGILEQYVAELRTASQLQGQVAAKSLLAGRIGAVGGAGIPPVVNPTVSSQQASALALLNAKAWSANIGGIVSSPNSRKNFYASSPVGSILVPSGATGNRELQNMRVNQIAKTDDEYIQKRLAAIEVLNKKLSLELSDVEKMQWANKTLTDMSIKVQEADKILGLSVVTLDEALNVEKKHLVYLTGLNRNQGLKKLYFELQAEMLKQVEAAANTADAEMISLEYQDKINALMAEHIGEKKWANEVEAKVNKLKTQGLNDEEIGFMLQLEHTKQLNTLLASGELTNDESRNLQYSLRLAAQRMYGFSAGITVNNGLIVGTERAHFVLNSAMFKAAEGNEILRKKLIEVAASMPSLYESIQLTKEEFLKLVNASEEDIAALMTNTDALLVNAETINEETGARRVETEEIIANQAATRQSTKASLSFSDRLLVAAYGLGQGIGNTGRVIAAGGNAFYNSIERTGAIVIPAVSKAFVSMDAAMDRFYVSVIKFGNMLGQGITSFYTKVNAAGERLLSSMSTAAGKIDVAMDKFYVATVEVANVVGAKLATAFNGIKLGADRVKMALLNVAEYMSTANMWITGFVAIKTASMTVSNAAQRLSNSFNRVAEFMMTELFGIPLMIKTAGTAFSTALFNARMLFWTTAQEFKLKLSAATEVIINGFNTAIINAKTLIQNTFLDLRSRVSSAGEMLQNAVRPLVSAFQTVSSRITQSAVSFYNSIKQLSFNSVKVSMINLAKSAGAASISLLQSIKAGSISLGNSMKTAGVSMWNSTKTMFTNLGNSVNGFRVSLSSTGVFKAWMMGIQDSFKATKRDIIETIKGTNIKEAKNAADTEDVAVTKKKTARTTALLLTEAQLQSIMSQQGMLSRAQANALQRHIEALDLEIAAAVGDAEATDRLIAAKNEAAAKLNSTPVQGRMGAFNSAMGKVNMGVGMGAMMAPMALNPLGEKMGGTAGAAVSGAGTGLMYGGMAGMMLSMIPGVGPLLGIATTIGGGVIGAILGGAAEAEKERLRDIERQQNILKSAYSVSSQAIDAFGLHLKTFADVTLNSAYKSIVFNQDNIKKLSDNYVAASDQPTVDWIDSISTAMTSAKTAQDNLSQQQNASQQSYYEFYSKNSDFVNDPNYVKVSKITMALTDKTGEAMQRVLETATQAEKDSILSLQKSLSENDINASIYAQSQMDYNQQANDPIKQKVYEQIVQPMMQQNVSAYASQVSDETSKALTAAANMVLPKMLTDILAGASTDKAGEDLQAQLLAAASKSNTIVSKMGLESFTQNAVKSLGKDVQSGAFSKLIAMQIDTAQQAFTGKTIAGQDVSKMTAADVQQQFTTNEAFAADITAQKTLGSVTALTTQTLTTAINNVRPEIFAKLFKTLDAGQSSIILGKQQFDSLITSINNLDPVLASILGELANSATPLKQVYGALNLLQAGLISTEHELISVANSAYSIRALQIVSQQEATIAANNPLFDGKSAGDRAVGLIANNPASDAASGGGGGTSPEQQHLQDVIKARQDSIDSINKEIDARQKLYDAKTKAIEQDVTLMNLQSDVANAMASGNLLELAKAQNTYNNELNNQAALKKKEAADLADQTKIDTLNDQIKTLQKKLDGMNQSSSGGGGGGSSASQTTVGQYTAQMKLAALQTKVKGAADALAAYAQTATVKIGTSVDNISNKFVARQVAILKNSGISTDDIYNAFVKPYQAVNPFEGVNLKDSTKKFMSGAYDVLANDPEALKKVGGYLTIFNENAAKLIDPKTAEGKWASFNFFESLASSTGLEAGSKALKDWKIESAKLLNLATVFDPNGPNHAQYSKAFKSMKTEVIKQFGSMLPDVKLPTEFISSITSTLVDAYTNGMPLQQALAQMNDEIVTWMSENGIPLDTAKKYWSALEPGIQTSLEQIKSDVNGNPLVLPTTFATDWTTAGLDVPKTVANIEAQDVIANSIKVPEIFADKLTITGLAAKATVVVPAGGSNLHLPNPGSATGGFISGPGTGTSDSIPTMLSNGEYVIRASSVSKYGQAMLDMINSGNYNPTFNSPTARSNYSTGGLVGDASSMSNVEYNINVNVAGSNADPNDIASAVMNALRQKEASNMTRRNIG